MNIAVFASGNGSNFQQITDFFSNNININIQLMLCNCEGAYVFERAKQLGVKSVLISKNDLKSPEGVFKILKDNDIDFIVLAGFLLLIPSFIVAEYPGRIVNIHPALLPKFGGKGMYGMRVHEAVIDAKEKESGITIHYVNNIYDSGQIIFQAKCSITDDDTPDTLAAKIHLLEKNYYPKVLNELFSALQD